MTIERVIQIAAEEGARVAMQMLQQGSGNAIKAALDKLAAEAVQAGADAVNQIKANERKELHDSRLHNTRLLLKNYRNLKLHFKEAVFEFDEEHQESATGMIWEIMSTHYDREQAFVDSIWKSAARTGVMIHHIDKMLCCYQVSCERSGRESDRRQWRILCARYLGDTPKSMQQIAEDEHIHKRTAEKDLDCAVQSVSALLFGVDAVQ